MKRETLRRTGKAAAGMALAAATTWAAWHAFLHVLGGWQSHVRLANLFLPEGEGWPLQGLRTQEYAAPAWLSLLIAATWPWVTFFAATLGRGELRAPWLLATLACTGFAIGAGEGNLSLAMFISVVAAWALGRLKNRRGTPAIIRADEIAGARGPGRVTAAKPVLMATLCAGTAWAGISFCWEDATFATLAGGRDLAISASLGSCIGIIAWFSLKRPSPMAQSSLAACIAIAIHIDAARPTHDKTWGARTREFSAWLASPAERIRDEKLAKYRLTAAAAAERRFTSAEESTKWEMLPELVAQAERDGDLLLKAWLLADAAIFQPTNIEHPSIKDDAIKSALLAMEGAARKSDAHAAITAEMTGWLLREQGQPQQAAEAFTKALRQDLTNPRPWLGLALCEAESGRTPNAARAAAAWMLLEPGAAFSPRLRRAPLRGCATEAFQLAETWVSECVPHKMAARLTGELRQGLRWRDHVGGMRELITENGIGTPACVELGRRLTRLHGEQGKAQATFLFSSAVVLLSDRYINAGQAEGLWKRFSEGLESPSLIPGIAPLKSRPIMRGWAATRASGEKTSGASLSESEEEPLAKLLYYAHAEHPQEEFHSKRLSAELKSITETNQRR